MLDRRPTSRRGDRVRFFRNQSFAGDDPEERDLFVEAVFLPQDVGPWQPVEDTGGILIKGSEIATIEFKTIHEVNNAE